MRRVRGSYASLALMEQKYNPATLKDGWNTLEDGERARVAAASPPRRPPTCDRIAVQEQRATCNTQHRPAPANHARACNTMSCHVANRVAQ
jgi:hypothetical protein